ncbi:MAG: hypothetical protein A3D24_03200 [Candidatus Blackburnbacteria bacterium RIFCSPHIGHO2_02_FULL_39_13]|uniref:Uncharacterized protein n=1 Tax=Candidatus Blackburnbacteria bacterium RIFCSPLOWO2_01_FULL_40_20 TaxID=1797519 RepID=A0A1G1VFJ0_9BACT|nr:MAG: hypothetical protein A2694_04500 [Candidatus Blackburnbacteria bacterium RIFCSPHIGHO2_01_FULL_40_17]OGY08836.1 MAG: hypothetical protein A3D24_03200 [Candidatus Blackburnbacteria bacterium RIFCSPHIGHO2_02_FULL_39_13]OGY14210.1 MAG: hypothetical protein A3A77_01885 [Candidatus Blackburnbacteria bacterium RIFCSPLOWO2_01_FULL_40_20]HBL52003.1 hypothetical protein [Candidatus Blackburnbacteria bacterium]
MRRSSQKELAGWVIVRYQLEGLRQKAAKLRSISGCQIDPSGVFWGSGITWMLGTEAIVT